MANKLLSTTSALALGLMVAMPVSVKADAMHDAAVWEFYLGVHGGRGMLDGKINALKVTGGNRGVFGGLAGVNFRQGYWLFGLEGDFGFSSKNQLNGSFCGVLLSCKITTNYHLRGRLGHSVTPNIDLFAAAGLALLDVKFGTAKKTLTGLSIGGGADIKLGQIGGGLNPVLRIEALYDMYGNKRLFTAPINYTARNWDDFTVRAAAMFSF